MKKERVVVKIGSSSLTNAKGEIDQEKFNDHIRAIVALRQAKHEVILVSSGAVAAGFLKLGYSSRPEKIKRRQAAAAVGQSLLIQAYNEKFSEHGIVPAQLLLTRGDFSDRERYRNAFATISELLERGILPIINENDTVVIDELTFGDNDMLSALVSGFVHANRLIILTDVNGLYDANPKLNPDAKKFSYLDKITTEMVEAAGGTSSKFGTGGMKSKLEAARIALSLGVPTFIGYGKGEDKLVHILQGKGDGTYISNNAIGSLNTSRQWIALHSETAGKLYVDKGAEKAIKNVGSSLLPVGVSEVEGTFQKGDVVKVFGTAGLIGKGEVSCSSKELIELMKKRNEKADNKTIGPTIEIIHRDKWVQI